MIDILQYWRTGRKVKLTPSGWHTGNAPCCIHNGESADKRQRGGLRTDKLGWNYHCFNCGFKASFKLGRTVNKKARKFLAWIGVSEAEIAKLNLDSLRQKDIGDLLYERKTVDPTVSFETKDLPVTARMLTESDVAEIEYIRGRSLSESDYPYMKDTDATRPGVLIPYTYKNNIVGWTTRFLDTRKPKYLSEQPVGYVFGTDLLKENWNVAIVVEGIIDALSIDGLGVLHNDISDTQAQILRGVGKEIVVVPDQDKAGLPLIKKAQEYGFSISIPLWPNHIKDVNDAVKEYGKLATILMIMQHKTNSKIKIKLAVNELKKKIELRKKEISERV